MEDAKAGVMIPIPQYPLYTAAIAELNAHPVSVNVISIVHYYDGTIDKLLLERGKWLEYKY